MNRKISLSIEDIYIKYAGEAFGATGSHNALTLRMIFGSAWDGTAKTAYFTDALGSASVSIVLGLDKLVGGAYEVDVPSEALKYAGEATVTIKGVLTSGDTTTKAITTAAGHFRVLDSELPESAGNAGTITPSDKDQLQAEIAGMETLFTTAKAAAEAAAANAKVSETNAKASETAAASSAYQAQSSAAAAAQSAASVDGINKTAQSWAVGGTGTRPGEDTDNAKYWAQQAQTAVGGDFATKTEAQGYVTAHNESVDAHPDLRVAVAGAVRYDTAQSLTDEQKAQAQTNINAAPGEFGLGGVAKFLAASDDLNTIWRPGWYQFRSSPVNAPTVSSDGWDGAYSAMFVQGRNSENVTQTILCGNTKEVFGCQIKRVCVTQKWQPWEWVNPPLGNGVEYRTTERFWGRPVYYKIVDCGQIADNKQVEHGIVNMRDCISFQGLRGGLPMPSITNNNLADPWSYYVADVSRTKITLACGTSAAGGNCHVMLKYTKTTD